MNAFELMAGRLVCERLSNIDLRVMEGIVKGLDDCHDNGDLEGYFELNTEFHGRTIAPSGNGVLTQVYADMFGKLQRGGSRARDCCRPAGAPDERRAGCRCRCQAFPR